MSKEVINAFHPDFVKTYLPDLLKDQITSSNNSARRTEQITEARKTVPNYGSMTGAFSKHKPRKEKPSDTIVGRKMTMMEAHNAMVDEINKKKLTTKQRVDLAPKEFKIYSRAGTANTKPKGKK